MMTPVRILVLGVLLSIHFSANAQKATLVKEVNSVLSALNATTFDLSSIEKTSDLLRRKFFHISRKKWSKIETFLNEIKRLEEINKDTLIKCEPHGVKFGLRKINVDEFEDFVFSQRKSLRMTAEIELENKKTKQLVLTLRDLASQYFTNTTKRDSIVLLATLTQQCRLDSIKQVQILSTKKIEQKERVRLAAVEIKKAFYGTWRRR